MHPLNNHQSNQKPAKPTKTNVTKPTPSSLTTRQLQQKIKKLSCRLSRENICKQHKLISNMNLKLQLRMEELIKLEQFKGLSYEECLRVINNLGCLQLISDSESKKRQQTDSSSSGQQHEGGNENHSVITTPNMSQEANININVGDNYQNYNNNNDSKIYKLKYPNAEKTIIVAGINRQWIQNSIKEFNLISSQNIHHRTNSYKKSPTQHYHHQICHVTGYNQFWVAIEADTFQNAQIFKKFIRVKKKSYEQRKDFSFKEDKRRVRIVMQNQDFYTLLVDAMTEKKNSEFIKRLVNPNSGLFPTMCLRDNKRVTVYPNEEYQSSLKKNNKILYFPIIVNRPESKEGEDHFSLDEVYSEDKSRASEMFDSLNNMEDLVQKADQGTQAESLGVGTSDELNMGAINGEVSNESNLAGQHSVKTLNNLDDDITCEMVSMKNKIKVYQQKSWQSLNAFESYQHYDDQIKDLDQNSKDIRSRETEEFVDGIDVKQQRQKNVTTPSSQNLININQNNTESQDAKDRRRNFTQNKKELNLQLKQQQRGQKLSIDIYDNNQLQEIKGSLSQQSQPHLNPLTTASSSTNKPSIPSLNDLRQPPLPKLITFFFSTHTQTPNFAINYTQMKKLQHQYSKKSHSRIKLTPGIPQQFRQVSQKQKNRDLFFVNIFKSMERKSQKQQYISDFF